VSAMDQYSFLLAGTVEHSGASSTIFSSFLALARIFFPLYWDPFVKLGNSKLSNFEISNFKLCSRSHTAVFLV
jgi:hypothetical protein